MKLICIQGVEGEEVNFYLRPDTALLRNNQAFYYPEFTQRLTAQVCCIYRIGRLGRSIAPRFAERYVEAIGTGVLFTAADVLQECVAKGKPWDMATGFDYSAAVSPEFKTVTGDELQVTSENASKLQVNTSKLHVKSSDNSQLVTRHPSLVTRSPSPVTVIAYVSRYLTLKIGDYIFVPMEEAREVKRGDKVEASLNGQCGVSIEVR